MEVSFKLCDQEHVTIEQGMRVIAACRDEGKGKEAVAQLLASTKDRVRPADDDATFEKLDVSSLLSVHAIMLSYVIEVNSCEGTLVCQKAFGDRHASPCPDVQCWNYDGTPKSFGGWH